MLKYVCNYQLIARNQRQQHKIQGVSTVIRTCDAENREIQLTLGQRVPKVIGRVHKETVVAHNAVGEEGKRLVNCAFAEITVDDEISGEVNHYHSSQLIIQDVLSCQKDKVVIGAVASRCCG